MDNILDFDNIQPQDDERIQIEYSEEFYRTAQDLSQYIHDLPLSHTENDTLIELILNQVKAASQDTFNQAFKMGVEFQKFTEEEEE